MLLRNLKFGKKTAPYLPSTTELLLEEVCDSFGTELLQAQVDDINGNKLVRVSTPIIHRSNGKNRVLQFQHTRFSPLLSLRFAEVYNENRSARKGKRSISQESILKEILEQHEQWDVIEEVTNNFYIENLELHRSPKGVYAAIYDFEKEEPKARPFKIHEPFELEGRLPQTHINFCIEPFFVIRGMRENTQNTYDSLQISFPKAKKEHEDSVHYALNRNPLDNLRNPEDAFKRNHGNFFDIYEVNSNVGRELTMGFIETYLRNRLSEE